MDGSSLIAGGIVVILIIMVIRAMTPASKEDYERARDREEHEIEMIRIAKEKRDAEMEARVPSGRGKTVRAKQN